MGTKRKYWIGLKVTIILTVRGSEKKPNGILQVILIGLGGILSEGRTGKVIENSQRML